MVSEKAKIHDLLRDLNGVQPGYVISNFKQVNSFSSLRQFIRCFLKFVIRDFFVLVCSYLYRKYSVWFSLAKCLKVKCDVVFLIIHKVQNQRYVVFDRCSFSFGFFKS